MAQPKTDGFLEYLVVHYRWILVCFFLLPLSFLYDLWLYVRNWLIFKLHSAPRNHDRKVKHVQKQVEDWIKSGEKTQMCTSRPGWQTVCFRRPLYKNTLHKIDVHLVDVLEIETERKVVRVEPLVTMGQLTASLNAIGWTIPVVPELDELTIGGLVMGTGVESSSHRYGLFQHICVSFELVLRDGSLVRCTKEHYPDLYHAIPWSYGTLGILTAVEIRIIPAKKFIKLTYHPFEGLNHIIEGFEKCINQSENEFVEGLMFSKESGVIMTGKMIDTIEIDKVNRIGRWYKPWFFKHVEGISRRNSIVTEYIPLRDYYHRHSRSLFWELQDIVPFGNNPMFRYLFGGLMPPKISLLKLTQTDSVKKMYENHHVVQDMLVPIENLQQSLELFHSTVQVYPLWLCAFLLPPNIGFVHPIGTESRMYVDVGVYGVPLAEDFEPKKSTRVLEKFVADVKGFQMLYADTYMTREEFRKMFDHSLYDQVRAELDCKNAFPEVYDKVSKDARY